MKNRLAITIISTVFFFYSAVLYAGVREPAVAGQFYPGDAKELSSYVDSLIAKVNSPAYVGEPIAFLSPHAGYPYSGEVAAYVYKQIAQVKPQTIILVGTAHYYPLNGGSIYPKGSFKTPLGEVPIDAETAKKIIDRNKSLIDVTELAHEKEHSLETQLPFLQRALEKFTIVPIIIGNSNFEVASKLGNAISEVVKENNDNHRPTILIASSDLAHYPNKSDAERSDHAVLDSLKAVDPKSFWAADQHLLEEHIPNLDCAMCGDLAMVTVLSAARNLGANQTTLLKYANSGDVPFGNQNKVVGYAAVVFSKKEAAAIDFSKSDLEHLNDSEKSALLKLSRKTLEEFTKSSPTETIPEMKDSEKSVAIFVTLKKNGELRGCIGSPEPAATLVEAVRRFTIAAASNDPRFSPVRADELAQIKIEISILSPNRKIKSADEIEAKKHGVILESQGRRGLFLPQVWEMLPDKTQFLNTLASEKAGLSPDAWKKPETNLYVFEVVSFEEGETK